MYTAPTNLYLTADRTRVVPEGDPDAAWLLVPAGGRLLLGEAARWGLLPPLEPPATQALQGPPTTQARRPARGK